MTGLLQSQVSFNPNSPTLLLKSCVQQEEKHNDCQEDQDFVPLIGRFRPSHVLLPLDEIDVPLFVTNECKYSFFALILLTHTSTYPLNTHICMHMYVQVT
ncbi:unnamed protein product [Cuscuta europaea]|uniref:Uncharacterized protein n=1 Tax=Cuscuta europaea TaxID=41803 RepID=A0A9P1EFS4_CUSEU|nr:unnamed protein product [Cuscuta europaea]